MTDLSEGRARIDDMLHCAWKVSDVRAMEAPLLERGVPLMRMAAAAVAKEAVRMLDAEGIDVPDADVVLLAGGGDNGGDGLFAAATLADQGARVTAIAVARSLHEAGLAAFARAGGRVLTLDPAADIPGCPAGFSPGEAGERLRDAIELASQSHLVIDAMTGIGLTGALRGPAATVAASIGVRPDEDGIVRLPDQPALPNREREGELPLVLAVDTPSGVGVDDGALPGPIIPADVTVTFGAMKPCAILPPATFACGDLVLVDFGFDTDGRTPLVRAVDETFAAQSVRLPRVDDTKYTRGVVGLATGSNRYPGAAVLGATAAARANTGMVRYLGPERAQDMVLAALPEAVIGKGHVQSWVVGSGVPDQANLSAEDERQRDTIGRLLEHYALSDTNRYSGMDGDARQNGTRETVATSHDEEAFDMPPIVVDAGALDLLPDRVPPQVVLTPHAGEMAKLVNRLEAPSDKPLTADDIMAAPAQFARYAAESTGATVLLKGAVTLIAQAPDPADHTSEQDEAPVPLLAVGAAPAWLSTAGAGDVLAGILGATLAQNADELDEFAPEAIAPLVTAGAFAHAAAASIASESEQSGWQAPRLAGRPVPQRFSSLGHPIVASDVVRTIPEALADIMAA